MKRVLITLTLLGGLVACGSDSNNSAAPPVVAENMPPQIDAIGDVSVEANTVVAPVTFTVDDDQTAPDDLTVTAESDNPGLIGDAELVLSGTGDDRTLVLTPRVEQTGMAVITLTVTDAEQLTSSSSFLLTVTRQSVAFSTTVRAIFDSAENAPPRQINALEFRQDGDNFDDLVAP